MGARGEENLDMQNPDLDFIPGGFLLGVFAFRRQDVLEVALAIVEPIYKMTNMITASGNVLEFYLHTMVNRFFSIYGRLPSTESEKEKVLRVMEGQRYQEMNPKTYRKLIAIFDKEDVQVALSYTLSLVGNFQKIVNDVLQKNPAILKERRRLIEYITHLVVNGEGAYYMHSDIFSKSILLCVKNYHASTYTHVKGVSCELVSILESIHQRVLTLEKACDL